MMTIVKNLPEPIERIEFLPETTPGGHRAPLDMPHLSGSQLSALTRCGAAYYFRRILRLPEPPSSMQIKGNSFHDGASAFFFARRAGKSIDEALVAAKQAALAYIRTALGHDAETNTATVIVDYGQRWYRGPFDTPRSICIDVIAALKHVFSQPQIAQLEALSIERGYVIYWKDKDVLPLVGYTDLVAAHGADAAVYDWKTGSKKKPLFALAMDPAQVGYAAGAAIDLGRIITDIKYATLSWDKPTEIGPDVPATVHFELQSRPFDPSRIQRLFTRCQEATADIRESRYRISESDYTCPDCAFRHVCSVRFGSLDVTVLNSAAHTATAIAAEAEAAAAATTEEPWDRSQTGPSAAQRRWITDMLIDTGVTLAQAAQMAGLSGAAHFDAIAKKDAGRVIDVLKPLAAKVGKEREAARSIGRQIVQARVAIQALSPADAARILGRHGMTDVGGIDSVEIAFAVLQDVAALYTAVTA